MSRMNAYIFLALAVVLLTVAVPVDAGDASASLIPFAEAERAYNAQDYVRAMELALPAAEAGNADAQYLVGRMYEKGQGVKKDKAKILTWYRRAAERGNAKAQYKIGVGYARGFPGLEQNNEKAKKWITMSAEQGYHRAQKVLAYAYQRGMYGFPKDEEKAQYWFREAEKKTIK